MRRMILGGMLILLWGFFGEAPLLAEESDSCVLQCVRSHPQWGFPRCRQIDTFMKGPVCYSIYNECLSQQCGLSWSGSHHPKAFIAPPEQLEDRWRQGAVCHPDVEKIPMEILRGDQWIDPQWSGQCECRNGQWIKAACGHKKATCQQVCNSEAGF